MFQKMSAVIIVVAVISACGKSQSAKATAQCEVKIPRSVPIPAGKAHIGNDAAYPEESPARRIDLAAFEIDSTEVTNSQFSEFVAETGYVTDAEKNQAGFGVPGGAVFKVPTASHPSWWQFVKGANWRHPEGPESSIKGRENDPVVQVSFKDANAYAKWKGRHLPSEAQWEYAAKAGAETLYVWGEELAPDGVDQSNTWQGAFPLQNTQRDGHYLRAPAGCYPPNDYGLYDMIGNVWEWTSTTYDADTKAVSHVIKGGSFLCAPNYCRRYRASARQPQETDFTTNHIGFRTVASVSK